MVGRRRGGMCDGRKFVVELVELVVKLVWGFVVMGKSLWRWMLRRVGGRVMSRREPPNRRLANVECEITAYYHCHVLPDEKKKRGGVVGRRRGGMCDGRKFVVKLVELVVKLVWGFVVMGKSLWRWVLRRVGGRVMSRREPPNRRLGMWNVKSQHTTTAMSCQMKKRKGEEWWDEEEVGCAMGESLL